MTLWGTFKRTIVDLLIQYAKRNPYFHIPDNGSYMERYWLLRPYRWLPIAIRLHILKRSDQDRHLHTHPWRSASWILRGGYTEVVPLDQGQHPSLDVGHVRYVWRGPGSFTGRKASDRHKILISKEPAVSVFIMWGKTQEWGFITPEGFVHWRDYLDRSTRNTRSPI